MSFWIPKPTHKVDPSKLELDEQERKVLERVDGATSVTHLGMLPGLSEPMVERVLKRLVAIGMVEPQTPDQPQDRKPVASSRKPGGLQPTQFTTPAPKPRQPPPKQPPEQLEDASEGLEWEPAEGESGDEPVKWESADSKPVERKQSEKDTGPNEEAKEQSEGEQSEGGEEEQDKEDAPSPLSDLQLGNYRKLYQTQLKHLERDQRVMLAETSTGEVLYALCYDEYPGVIQGILDNPQSGLNHARMIARYHNKAIGLDKVIMRSQFLRDALVERHLLRNVQTPESGLKRLLRTKPLIKLFKLNYSREISNPAVRVARQTFRSKFQSSPADARMSLIFGTEGRCLQALSGVPLDESFVALFVKRTINSMLLVQNLARHAACPPNVIRHLWKQVIVKRQRHLRVMLLKHPNCPGEFKRPGAAG